MLLATILVYFGVVLALGVFAQRQTNDGEDFMLGGRQTGPLVAAIGAAASSSSAWSLLGVSGAAYAWGLSALWLFPSCVGGFALNWFVMARPVRDAGHDADAHSVPDLLGGGAVRGLASIVILVCLGAYVASQFQGAGKTFHATFGIDRDLAIVVGAAAVFFYTMLGGFLAVSLTDTLQGLVMAGTAVVLPVAAFVHVGGASGLTEGLAAVDAAGYLSIGGPRTPVVAFGFALGLLGIGFGYAGQPHVLKYFLAMRRGEGLIARGRAYSMVWAVVTYGGMILLGLCGRVMFPEIDDKEAVLVRAAETLFHPVLAGVMLAAVLSAIMSTADSQLLVAAGTVTHDLGLGRGRDAKAQLRIIRGTVLGLTVGAALAALFGSQEIFDTVLFGWAAMGAGFGPLIVVRWVLKREVPAGARVGLVAYGAGFAALSHLFYRDIVGNGDFRGVFVHVVPFTTALIAAVAISRRRDD